MSSLTGADKEYLETILDMGGGFVLDFSDNTFDEFFSTYGIDIGSGQYQKYGLSKAREYERVGRRSPTCKWGLSFLECSTPMRRSAH